MNVNVAQNNPQFSNQENLPMPPNWNMPTANVWWMNPWLYYNAGNAANQRSAAMGGNSWFNGAPPANNQANAGEPSAQPSGNVPNNPPQQPQESPNTTSTRPTVACGIISDPNEIKPADIPMDGGFGMFMNKDLSAIYIKQWQSDGKIYTKTFVETIEETPEEPVNTSVPSEEFMDQIDERFQKIENTLMNLCQMMNGNSSEMKETVASKKTKKNGGTE